MEKITLTDDDIEILNEHPELILNTDENTIAGTIYFDLKFPSETGKRIKDSYCIEILLFSPKNSILPVVKEINGRIKQIAKRKKIDKAYLHLNSDDREMCIIIPPKEVERYPNGFQLKEYLHHIQEHLYWISYFERYGKEPWKGQAHGDIGYLELFNENRSKYRQQVKEYFEQKNNTTYNRQQFNYLMRTLIKKEKI